MTLVETLIGTLIFSFVITGVYLLYTTMQGTMSRGELMSDLQQNARVGLAQMTQEIRMTGYDPSGVIPQVALSPKAPVRAAAEGCFSFVADWQGSGTADQVTYDFNLAGKTLRRRVDNWKSATQEFSGGSAQALAQSVESVKFTYYDANNKELAPLSWTSTQRCPPDPKASAQATVQLTFEQMRLIRRVAIALKMRGSRPDVYSEFFTLTSDVRLRNQ